MAENALGAPLAFVRNEGQLDSRVRYNIQGAEASLFFTDRGVRMSLSAAAMSDPATNAGNDRWVVDHAFIGAGTVEPIARQRSEMTVNYFKGDRSDWKTGLATFERVVYRDVWRGIDLVYSGTGEGLVYDLVVHPGADPDNIRLAWQNASTVRATDSGDLEIATPIGSFRDEAPVAYQRVAGQRVVVPSHFEVGPRSYRFDLSHYDKTRTVVVDPAVLIYAGFIGGTGTEGRGGIAVDSAGNAYVVGSAASTEASFPETGGPDLTHNGNDDVFVAKVAANGSALTYAGYIGGTGSDTGGGIAIDSSGAAYVVGSTDSTEASFPVIGGPDVSYGGMGDAFVAKVTPNGSALVYAGYIGGSELEFGNGIAVDSSGNAYVAGRADSTEASFPVTGGPDLTHNGGADAFVAKVAANGSALNYAGYIGGSGTFDLSGGIAVDSSGAAYVTGFTDSTEASFPVTGGPDLTYNGGALDAFVAKVAANGSALTYAGYIGGSGFDTGRGIAVDSSGNAYVTGDADSTEASFPVSGGPDLTHNGGIDAYVAKITATGSALTYAGYIGGSGTDVGFGIAIDSAGSAYITGRTDSTEASFPEIGGPDVTHNGGADVFVAKVTETFTLTASKAGAGSGTVTSSPAGIDCGSDCTEDYSKGTSVTLTATPAAGSGFSGWSGACSGTGACTLTMSENRAVTAIFNTQHALTVITAGGGTGTVTSSPAGIDCGSDCTEAYVEGTTVTLTAAPATGSEFGSWAGCDSMAGSQCTVTMSSDKTVTATFDEAPVVHQRRVSLSLRGHLTARGRVRVPDGFDACAASVPVKIQRRSNKRWVTLKKTTTGGDGKFRASLKDRAGKYRAMAPARALNGGDDICRKATSPVVRR